MILPPNPTTLPHRTIRALARMVPPSLLWGVLLGVVVPLGAQEVEARMAGAVEDSSVVAWEPPRGTVDAVARELAGRWGVPPGTLVMEWTRPRGEGPPEGPVRVDLLGSGRDGRWVATVRSDGAPGQTRSVLLRAGVLVQERVALRSLERGEALRETDMGVTEGVLWGGPEEEGSAPEAGWIAQRRIATGEVLRAPALRPPLLVVMGQPVRAVWEGERVSVALAATAVSSGALGERVMVRTDTGQRLEGVVQGPGRVLVGSPTMEIGR